MKKTLIAALVLFSTSAMAVDLFLRDDGIFAAASVAVGNITGLGTGVGAALAINVGTAGSPVVNGGVGGTPSSINLTNGTSLPTTALTGTLQAAQEPAHTGDVTNTAGSRVMTLAAGSASVLNSGTLAAARGGAGTINGALKANGAGTVSQAACADLSNGTTVCSAAVGQLPGTTTNDDAAAGKVGEVMEQSIASGSAVSMTSGVALDVATVSITAGDWNCWGNVAYVIAGGTTVTFIAVGLHTVSGNNMPGPPNGGSYQDLRIAFGAGDAPSLLAGQRRYSVNTTTPIYLKTTAAFGVSTLGAYGYIGCRRMR